MYSKQSACNVGQKAWTIFIRPKRCIALGEYWIYPMSPKNGLHAAGYNSAESEPIWMKFGKLWAKCWGCALQVSYGQPPTFGSQLSKFHPNRFTFGGVIAGRVKAVLWALWVNPIAQSDWANNNSLDKFQSSIVIANQYRLMHLLFNVLVINKLTYSVPAYSGQLTADDKQNKCYTVSSSFAESRFAECPASVSFHHFFKNSFH